MQERLKRETFTKVEKMPSLAPSPPAAEDAAAAAISFMMGRDNKRRRHQQQAIKKRFSATKNQEKIEINFLLFFICVFKLEKVLCECLSRNDCDYHAKKRYNHTSTSISQGVCAWLRKRFRGRTHIVKFNFFSPRLLIRR